MLEIKVNYEDLVEMPIEKAKEIVAKFDYESFIEDISCNIDGVKYGIYIVDKGDWKDYGKYQYRTDIGLLYEVDNDGKVVMYDVAVTQDITRSGSYFSEYYYEYEPLQVNKVINKVIPQQIIPERTVVTIEE